jgi:hypothetical protein
MGSWVGLVDPGINNGVERGFIVRDSIGVVEKGRTKLPGLSAVGIITDEV